MGKSQLEIAGTEREVNKKVENAGDLLVSATKKKTSASKNHKEAENRLLEVMRDEKVRTYTSESLGKTFEVDDVEKVKVYAWKPIEPPKAEA
jgi:predicted transcriptional regulator